MWVTCGKTQAYIIGNMALADFKSKTLLLAFGQIHLTFMTVQQNLYFPTKKIKKDIHFFAACTVFYDYSSLYIINIYKAHYIIAMTGGMAVDLNIIFPLFLLKSHFCLFLILNTNSCLARSQCS